MNSREKVKELVKARLDIQCEVINLKEEYDYDVYIGRPSKWGNPYAYKNDGSTLAKYVVNSRDEAIDAYREYIRNGDGKPLLDDLCELRGKRLGCWCKPERCHGDVLAELVLQKYLKSDYKK